MTESDRQELRRYAGDTWRSFEAMTTEIGLPADKLIVDPVGHASPAGATSPTDIASYLWSLLAAEKLGIIGRDDADGHLDRVLTALGKLRRDHGFFLNRYDPNSGEPADRVSGHGAREPRFLSTVDNAWLAAALILAGNARPNLRPRTEALLGPMDFAFFYDPFDPADPIKHPGQFRGGFYPDTGKFLGHYGMVNTEPRIASYVAIGRGQVPPDHYFRLSRTLPAASPQCRTPQGEVRTYRGVPVFEGHYEFRGMDVVPSWGGSMFEALMVPLFVPEARWAPESWGVNHPIYTRAQIEQGLIVRKYGVWGFSPALDPAGGYRTYGVDGLGTEAHGYRTFDPVVNGDSKAMPDGVVDPPRFLPRAGLRAPRGDGQPADPGREIPQNLREIRLPRLGGRRDRRGRRRRARASIRG